MRDVTEKVELPADREKRARRRLAVGITAPRLGQSSGHTTNLAVHGLSVSVGRVFPRGTLVKVVVQLPDQERAAMEAEVTWARRGSDGAPSSMGLRVTGQNAVWQGFLKRFHPELFR